MGLPGIITFLIVLLQVLTDIYSCYYFYCTPSEVAHEAHLGVLSESIKMRGVQLISVLLLPAAHHDIV